jgi:hypothetical protein
LKLNFLIIRVIGASRELQSGLWGGVAGGIGIKVGIMVPACCECNPGGSIADPLYPKAPVFAQVSGQ